MNFPSSPPILSGPFHLDVMKQINRLSNSFSLEKQTKLGICDVSPKLKISQQSRLTDG